MGMKRAFLFSLMLIVFTSNSFGQSQASPLVGSNCKVLGKKINESNKNLICSKKGKKLVWKISKVSQQSIPSYTLEFKGVKFTYPSKVLLPSRFLNNSNECISIPITVKSQSLGFEVIIYIPDAKQTTRANLLGDPKSALELYSPKSLNENIKVNVCNYDIQRNADVTINRITEGTYFLALSDWGFNINTPGKSYIYGDITFVSE